MPEIAIAYGVVSRPTPHRTLMALKAICQLLLVARSCSTAAGAAHALYSQAHTDYTHTQEQLYIQLHAGR